MAGGKARAAPKKEGPRRTRRRQRSAIVPSDTFTWGDQAGIRGDLRHRAPTAGGGGGRCPLPPILPPFTHILHIFLPHHTHTGRGDPSYCAGGSFDRPQPGRRPRRGAARHLQGRLPQRHRPSPAALPSGGREAHARGGAPGAAAILVLGSVRGGNGTAPSAGTPSPLPAPRCRPAEPSLLPFSRPLSQPAGRPRRFIPRRPPLLFATRPPGPAAGLRERREGCPARPAAEGDSGALTAGSGRPQPSRSSGLPPAASLPSFPPRASSLQGRALASSS